METECSLPLLQEPATSSYPESDQSSPRPILFTEDRLPSMHRYFKLSLSSGSPTKIPVLVDFSSNLQHKISSQ